MAWWKFWTWGRPDDTHASDRTQKDPGRHDPDDILMSISGLIDNHQDDLVDFIRTTRTAEMSVVTDNVPISAGAGKATDTVAGTQTTELTAAPSGNEVTPTSAPVKANPTVPVEISPGITARPHELLTASLFGSPPPPAPKSVREPLNRDAARKDPRKTLVAEDGQWPTLKGLSESFNDLDESDDLDGPSPFQTIVPNDH